MVRFTMEPHHNRTKVNTTELTRTQSYEVIAKKFGLPTKRYKHNYPLTPFAKAVWFMSQDVRSKRISGMWGGSERHIVARSVHRNHVEIYWAGPRRLSYKDTIESYNDFWCVMDRGLSVDKIPVDRYAS